ncbi:ECF transporter S component [Paenibacillus pectinilyticus]|uniref:ECF transporter S component n=1 Tax=Paenibacillus pectinilyticus TaxID=512399 RepID=A0A1C1A2M5_9BACL|nr:ECF transporter S component [Paenibacillus pectinilyticus]OCT14776.1 ECF transporter S component [Paenibacillus pectinilyticus]
MQEKRAASKRLSRRTMFAALLILIVIPATIMLGIFVLDDRKYYFISLLIVLYTMIPFVMVFENRKPQARELIVIAVLAAIAVAGRGAFFMLPQFKPVVAIVIIAGVCFGAEAGFLVGATAGFVSNFFFGQGPWTPWQMFCFGLIGFVAGILFKKGLLKKTKLSLCVFGGLATLVIYGGIINLGSLLMVTPSFSWAALLATYASGFWFDLVHAIATVFFLFVISGPMIEKLERIKMKYGLMDSQDGMQR